MNVLENILVIFLVIISGLVLVRLFLEPLWKVITLRRLNRKLTELEKSVDLYRKKQS